MNRKNPVGDAIRRERKNQMLTIKRLAEKVGCSEQAISQYERGMRTPKLETLGKIASALNVPVGIFVNEVLFDVVAFGENSMKFALDLVTTERQRQTNKWGDQSGNHPFEWMSILGEEYGELCEAVNETCFKAEHVKPERGGLEAIKREAVHVAAVAVAIVEAVIQQQTKDREVI